MTLSNQRLAWTAAILAALFLAGCAPEYSAEGTVDRSFTVNGPVRLEISNGSGDTRISAGNPGTVEVHALIRMYGWSPESAQQDLRDFSSNPPITQDGNFVHVGMPGFNSIGRHVSIEYSVTTPPDTDIRGASGSGDVELNGIQGPAEFTIGSGSLTGMNIANDVRAIVGSGSVTLSNSQGLVSVSTGSGSIVIRGSKGEVRARAGSGSIRIEQPGDRTQATTGSGDIDVSGAVADLRLHTGSGSISIDGNPGAMDFWDARTGSGGIQMHVPANASFEFSGRTSSGSIDVTVPNAMVQSSGRHELDARIGDGKARVEVSTGSGDVGLH